MLRRNLFTKTWMHFTIVRATFKLEHLYRTELDSSVDPTKQRFISHFLVQIMKHGTQLLKILTD